MGRATESVRGGGLASGPEYDAVLCMPAYDESAGIEAGWYRPVVRCEESVALVTPNIAMGTRSRLIEQTHPFELGGRTHADLAVEADSTHVHDKTALELGVTEDVTRGPRILRRATGCLELRRSGLAPCCKHPRALDPSVVTSTGSAPRIYIPPPSLWDVDFSDPAHGVVVVSRRNTYQAYLDNCPLPMAADDEVVSEVVFFLLSERIDETDVTPFRLPLTYPDGGDRPTWFETSRALGDIVGFGSGEPGRSLLDFQQGVRRVATAATALRRRPDDPSVLDPAVWRFTADGGQFRIETPLIGDGLHPGGAGAAHMDFAAPWLFAVGGVRRVYAAHVNGNNDADADREYATHLTDATAPYLRAYFDPDGDGIARGFRDARTVTGDLVPGYVDADGDGLSEYRVVSRAEGGARCVEAIPPLTDRCWLPTGNDNCAPPTDSAWLYPYSNPEQRDRDGDGIGDACDTCPVRWQASQDTSDALLFCPAARDLTAEESPSGAPIARGQPAALVCMRTDPRADAMRNYLTNDGDEDGARDAVCDNCAVHAPIYRDDDPTRVLFAGRQDCPRRARCANDDQDDVDLDGVGDACDNCPMVSNPRRLFGDTWRQDGTDTDGDGVPDACDNCVDVPNRGQENVDGDRYGDACDNCPLHDNSGQDNCNLDAEIALGRTELGVTRLGDACDPAPCALTTVTVGAASTDPLGRRTTTMDRILYDARVGTEDPTAPPASLMGRTTLRFCRCSAAGDDSPLSRTDCAENEFGPGDGLCSLVDLVAHDVPEEEVPWRWMTVSGGATNPTLVDPYRAPTTAFVADRTTRWSLQSIDIPRWLSTDLADDPATMELETETFTPGTSVPGVLWTHTPGEAGMPDFDELPAFGVEFRQRASHYWSGGVEPSITTREPFPCFIPFAPFLGGSRICPFCRGHLPQPWLGFPALFGCGGVRFEAPFIQLGGFVIEPNEVHPFPGLEQLANDPGPWVAAAETGDWLHARDGIRYVGLAEGRHVRRFVFEVDGQLVDPSNNNCPQCPAATAIAPLAALAATPLGPLAREGHSAVLSSTHAALFTIGGRDLAGGGELRDLWRYDLATGAWRALPIVDATLGTVLAATYSPVRDRLVVLDEVFGTETRGRGRRARVHVTRTIRLLELSPEGGRAAVRASWPRRSGNTTYAMSVDPAGGVWLAASPEHPAIHAVARLTDPAGALAIDGWTLGVGRLVPNGARADDAGLTVVTQLREVRSPRIVHHATPDLRRVPGGDRECF